MTFRGEQKFESEILVLDLPCEAEYSGPLITVEGGFTGPLHMRGLQVHACASSSLSVLSEGLRLARCSDGDVCGDAATCADVVPLPSAPDLTTADCSCQGEYFPSPAAMSLALAPYGFDPSVDYCVRCTSPEYQHNDPMITRLGPPLFA